MAVNVVGVYTVAEASDPCHLIELDVDARQPFDVGQVTQRNPKIPQSDWQVPYEECLLTAEGHEAPEWPPELTGRFRIAFYFHYLAFDQPLLTPEGPVTLPHPQQRPARLDFMDYEPPD